MAYLVGDAHRDRHRWLQHALDELVEDYVRHHLGQADSVVDLSVRRLLTWAHAQAQQPTEPYQGTHRDGILLYAWVDDAARIPIPITSVPIPAALLDHAALVATTPDVLEAQRLRAGLEEHVQIHGRTLRLVRCVEVETLHEVAPDSDR